MIWQTCILTNCYNSPALTWSCPPLCRSCPQPLKHRDEQTPSQKWSRSCLRPDHQAAPSQIAQERTYRILELVRTEALPLNCTKARRYTSLVMFCFGWHYELTGNPVPAPVPIWYFGSGWFLAGMRGSVLRSRADQPNIHTINIRVSAPRNQISALKTADTDLFRLNCSLCTIQTYRVVIGFLKAVYSCILRPLSPFSSAVLKLIKSSR